MNDIHSLVRLSRSPRIRGLDMVRGSRECVRVSSQPFTSFETSSSQHLFLYQTFTEAKTESNIMPNALSKQQTKTFFGQTLSIYLCGCGTCLATRRSSSSPRLLTFSLEIRNLCPCLVTVSEFRQGDRGPSIPFDWGWANYIPWDGHKFGKEITHALYSGMGDGGTNGDRATSVQL